MDMPGYASAPEDEMWLTVLLPPKQGQHPFDCGAPFIWRVSDEDVRAYGLDGNRYVCVHQVWAD
jgi:hypothetical protein